jgi:hypothetical protein
MSDSPISRPQGLPPPTLILCRQCVQYVFEGTETCPHCGRDAREIGARYRDEGYLAADAIRQIERALERHDEAPQAPGRDRTSE